MGGQFSNLFGKKKENEDEANLRRYQEVQDAGGTFIGDELDKKKVAWWQFLIFDKRFRIFYVFLLALVLGILIPVIIFATKLEKKEKAIYGSCMVKAHARFECLPNSVSPVNQATCTKALCCWQEKTTEVPFNCYHSFPSAYQYNLTTSKNDNLWSSLETEGNKEISEMSPLRVITHWESEEHLVVEIFNAKTFLDRVTPTLTSSTSARNGFPNENEPFNVTWSEDGHFFFLKVARRDTDETIFDTRLGPVYTTQNEIVLTTLLPTEYFYGLKGGQGSVSTLTYGVVNGFENSEFPFYISYENSSQWHGVLIDTKEPFLAQVAQAPGLMLYFESDRPEINLHFFAGPTQEQILQQLQTYIREKHQINIPPMIPPYWGLGLHLCRRVENSSRVLEDIQELIDNEKIHVVYDSDCIDEHLRNPIYFNETHFTPNLTEIVKLLNETSTRKILLSQSVMVPLYTPDEEEETTTESQQAHNIDAKSSLDENLIYFEDLLVLNTKNSSNITPYVGQLGNESLVTYIDVFNDYILEKGFPPVPPSNEEMESFPYHGFSLVDNIPKMDSSVEHCSRSSSKIQSYFISPSSTSGSSSVNASTLWGSLCPEGPKHNLSRSADNSIFGYQNHQVLHNVYGEQLLKIVYNTETQRQQPALSNDEMLISSGSFWISSLYYGAYNGMQVPFTWRGLQESVANIVRNYALAPISGTPICGAMLENNVTFPMNNELCLRWFQFGLLLPFARNSYDGKSSFGPLQLPSQYRGYLNDAIKSRYTYAPYYYTELRNYQATYIPLIRPMSFDFSQLNEAKNTLPIVNQFMIGNALLAAPIIDKGSLRSAYFPAGVWYTMDGLVASDASGTGVTNQITGYITETPLFIRGGYIIPTLQTFNEDYTGLPIEDTLKGNYTLLVALSTSQQVVQTAKGSLIVKEPNSDGTTHSVDFSTEVNNDNTRMTITVSSKCGYADEEEMNDSLFSTTIEHIQVFGLKFMDDLDIRIITSDENYAPQGYEYFGENRVLRIFYGRIDWCKYSEYQVTVVPKQDATTIDDATTEPTSTAYAETETTETSDIGSTQAATE